jgi:hypothetical protein
MCLTIGGYARDCETWRSADVPGDPHYDVAIGGCACDVTIGGCAPDCDCDVAIGGCAWNLGVLRVLHGTTERGCDWRSTLRV